MSWPVATARRPRRTRSSGSSSTTSRHLSSQGIVEAIDGNPNARRLRFQQDAKGVTRYPTVRVDYNLSSMHRLTGSWTFNDLVSTPDTTNDREPRFPGFPVTGAQVSDRYVFTTALRSSISTNIVNEVRYGMSGGATLFSPGLERRHVERLAGQPGRIRPGDRSGRLRADRRRQLGYHPGRIGRRLLGP